MTRCLTMAVSNPLETNPMNTTLNPMTRLYQQALDNMRDLDTRYGTAEYGLTNGATLYCCIDPVAGRSIVRTHQRVTYRLRPLGHQYSKQISQDAARRLITVC